MIMKNKFFDIISKCYGKFIDWLMSFSLFIMFVLSFFIKEHNFVKLYNVSFKVLGVFGIAYLIVLLFRFFCQKIKFDYTLVKGRFLHKVINISLTIPFVLTCVFMICEIKSVVPANNKMPELICNDSTIYNDSVKYDFRAKLKDNICHLWSHNKIYDSIDKASLQNSLAKKLAFSENLYKKVEDTLLIKDTSAFYKIESFAKLVDWKIEFDSTANEYYFFRVVDELPENIIDAKNEEPSLLWSVYYHYIDPGNQHIASTEKGRKWAAAIAILGYFFLNGLLVAVLIGWFDRRREEWLNGEIRYKLRQLPKNKYAVVIGANEVAPSVIKNLLTSRTKKELNFKCERNNKYIILQTNRDPQTVREELAVYMEDKELRKVIIYKALRNSKSEIEKLHLNHATEIYVLGESTLMDGGETYHDAMNMKCVNIIADVLSSKRRLNIFNNKSKRKVCKVMFEYQTTYSVFQFSDVSEKIKNNLVFIPFNRYESWARKVMVESFSKDAGVNIEYIPLDGSGITSNSSEHVHFVVVGMSKMGIAMGLQAMLQAHYLNYAAAENIEDPKVREDRKDATRTRITFIDTNADKEKDFFMGRYESLFKLVRHRYFDASNLKECKWIDPMKDENCKWKHLSRDGQNFLDIEIEFVKGELESEGVRRYLRNISDKNNDFVKESKLTIAICLTQTHQAIAASLYMPIEVYGKVQQIWVYQREASDIINNLNDTKTKDERYKKLRPFGMLYGEYMSDRAQYLRALLVNGSYDIGVNGGKYSVINMVDKKTYKHIRETWGILSLDKKFSNRYFADSIYLKVRSVMKDDDTKKVRSVMKDDTKKNELVVTYRRVFDLLKSDVEFLENLKPLMGDDELAISEHNRWDIQQLLFGYSPCCDKVDKEFKKLNGKLDKDERNAWREKYVKDNFKDNDIIKGWGDLSPLQQLKAKDEESYSKTSYGIYDKKKKDFKEGVNRLHPNICEFEHLSEIDSGAKGYDKTLNNAIPRILELVDGYNTKLQ